MIPILFDDEPESEPTDPFGRPACTIVGSPIPERIPSPPRPVPSVERYVARYPPTLDLPVTWEPAILVLAAPVALDGYDDDSESVVIDLTDLAPTPSQGSAAP